MVERYVRDVEAAGSNPVTSTIKKAPPLWRCFLYAWGGAAADMICEANAGSHLPLEDRQARLSGAERANLRAMREYPVTSTITQRAQHEIHRVALFCCFFTQRKSACSQIASPDQAAALM